jgi:hypothetical protein
MLCLSECLITSHPHPGPEALGILTSGGVRSPGPFAQQNPHTDLSAGTLQFPKGTLKEVLKCSVQRSKSVFHSYTYLPDPLLWTF